MKIKDGAIKPGMIIHCPKKRDARMLMGYLNEAGYAWSWSRKKVSNSDIIYTHGSDTCYCVCAYGKYIYHCDIKDAEGLISEFSDLIEPEPKFKVGDKVRVKKIDESREITPVSSLARRFEGTIFTITTVTEHNDGVLYATNENAYNWSEEILEPVADSLINSDTDSPMTAEELLEKLREIKNKGKMSDTFGCLFENLLDFQTNEEILDDIAAYEAAKKAPKPVEVECGWLCRVYNDMDVCEEYERWEGDEQAAWDDAIDRAMKHMSDTLAEKVYAEVIAVCRVKEDK